MKAMVGGYDVTGMGRITPYQAALKWVLQNPKVTAAIPGMKDMAQLKEDITVMGMPFTYSDLRRLDHYDQAIAGFYCTFCGTCEVGCPHGVEISTVNRALMYAEGGYRNIKLARDTYAELPLQASAATCLDCEGCRARCVNGLDIASKMNHARTVIS